MKRIASLVVAALMLIGGAGCERMQEADRRDLSVTDPEGTLPVMSDSTAPAAPPGATSPASETAPAIGTMGDDSGFDPVETPPGTATATTTAPTGGTVTNPAATGTR